MFAALDWQYRKEYNKLAYKDLVSKAITLTQNTNRLHKENEKLSAALNKPWKFFKLGFMAVGGLLILIVVVVIAVRIVLKVL